MRNDDDTDVVFLAEVLRGTGNFAGIPCTGNPTRQTNVELAFITNRSTICLL